MGQSHTKRFWDETERYHDLAEQFDRGITVTHPSRVTTNRLVSRFQRWSKYKRTAIVYREYRGPRPPS